MTGRMLCIIVLLFHATVPISIAAQTASAIKMSEQFNASLKRLDNKDGRLIKKIYVQTNTKVISPDAIVYQEHENDIPIFLEIDDSLVVSIKTSANSIQAYRCEKLFYNLSSLSDIDLTGIDTSKCTNMDDMFRGCSSLKRFDLNILSLSSIVFMRGMFQDCASLEEIGLSDKNMPSLGTLESFLENCRSLRKAEFINLETPELIRTLCMFRGCENLITVDLSGISTSKVVLMAGMFEGCRMLPYLNIKHFETNKASWTSRMFYGCEALKYLDISSMDTSNVETMKDMFYGSMKNGGQIIVGRSFVINDYSENMFMETGAIDIKGKMNRKNKNRIISKIHADQAKVLSVSGQECYPDVW